MEKDEKIENLKKYKKQRINEFPHILSEGKEGYVKKRKKDLITLDNNLTGFGSNMNNSHLSKSKRTFFLNYLTTNELNSILFKLKEDYNLITNITTERKDQINKLNDKCQKENEKLTKISEYLDYELTDEKVSFKSLGDSNTTKEELKNYINELIKEKKVMEGKVYNETEYAKSVEYILENENKKLYELITKTNQLEVELKSHERYSNLINENLGNTNLKNNDFLKLKKNLEENINIANKIMSYNTSKNNILENKIYTKEGKIRDLKEKILNLKEQNKIEYKNYKEDIYQIIDKSKEEYEEKKQKEKQYIDIIFSLYILQKYFLEQNNFDENRLILSNDYKILINKNYIIDNNIKRNEKIEEENYEKENIKDNINPEKNEEKETNCKINSEKKIEKENDKGKKEKDVDIKERKSLNNKKINLTIDEIERKFNSINLNKKLVLDYISKTSTSINFNKKRMNDLHKKENILEEKKDKFDILVKKIMNENYLTFEEVSKNNSKISTFLTQNKNYIEKMKEKKINVDLIEINKIINLNETEKDNIISDTNNMSLKEFEEYTKRKNMRLEKEQTKINSLELYKKAINLITFHNKFFDNIIDLYRNLIINTQSNTELYQKIKEQFENIITFRKLYLENPPKDHISFINYLEKLIDYYEVNLQDKNFIDEYKNNLLFLFFENYEKKILNELFYKQFSSKENLNKNNIFNHFYTLKNDTLNMIESIISFINKRDKYENLMIDIEGNNGLKLSNAEFSEEEFQINNKKDNSKDELLLNRTSKLTTSPFFRKINPILKKSKISSKNLNPEMIKDDDIDLETSLINNENKIFKKKRINQIERSIVEKLYMPSFERFGYLRKINNNIKVINKLSLNNSKLNFILKKKKNEISLMDYQMYLYNNPKVHIDELYRPIFKNINELMVEERKTYLKKEQENRIKSTIPKRKLKFIV